jgi:hypothetical protein
MQMAYNVPATQCFDRPNGETRSFSRAGKMWVNKTAQKAFPAHHARPTAVLWTPEWAFRPAERVAFVMWSCVFKMLFDVFYIDLQ